MINGITRQLLDAATQDAWIVKTSLQCLRENISACHAPSVTTALSCELTANTMINMTAPDLEKLIPTSMPQVEDIQLWMKRKALEVILELHVWIDANDVGTTRWIAKGDVNRKKVCRVVAVMSTTTVTSTETEIITDTETSTATEITTDTETSTGIKITTDTETSTATEITTDTETFTAITISTDTATSTTILCMEKSTECSENAITNTGQTRIAVESAVFILSSDTI